MHFLDFVRHRFKPSGKGSLVISTENSGKSELLVSSLSQGTEYWLQTLPRICHLTAFTGLNKIAIIHSSKSPRNEEQRYRLSGKNMAGRDLNPNWFKTYPEIDFILVNRGGGVDFSPSLLVTNSRGCGRSGGI
jgi:hypothetical protein